MDNIKQVILFHNPGAGEESHPKEQLINALETNGFTCRYLSTKDDGWKDFDTEADLFVIAGGDGTVKKFLTETINRHDKDKIKPITILPLGTANNIANTLGIVGDSNEIISSWHDWRIKKIDSGKTGDEKFFIEGIGLGMFPHLVNDVMKQGGVDAPEGNVKKTLQLLQEMTGKYEPLYYQLNADGSDHSGKFYLIEIMNIKSIGPGLLLSPHGDPGDGELEVILIPEAHKDKLAGYIADRLEGREVTAQFHTLKAKNISVNCSKTDIHVDDEMNTIDGAPGITVAVQEGSFEFLVPQ